ncbi:DUF4145 domain-containing protein [Microbulbifer agarilyticus]|uniref:hypothetical protein n=1 Tax=Microbulbifer agarilyticus TaxID=260552 RepID=UPI001CD1975A|nr:hypothetical protein [Microbulbifer agarilyticus]MCA0893854.1 hypothetical protein [Microbulbifer agarilyticus]
MSDIAATLRSNSIELDREPDNCPRCRHGINPEGKTYNLKGRVREYGSLLQVVYRCPLKRCSELFIANYSMGLGRPYILQSLTPIRPTSRLIPQEVLDVSPAYGQIFSEASAAEDYGLTEIAGVGYRKALEFLVKDYCVFKLPEKEEDIKRKQLGNVINEFVDEESLKQIARRAAWLGNDETHYVRRWENKDITDLKRTLQLTEGWIHREILTAKTLEEMASG